MQTLPTQTPPVRNVRTLKIVSIAGANLVAICTKILLDGGIGLFPLVLYVTLVSWLGVAKRTNDGTRRWVAPTYRSVVFLSALLLLVGVLITPFASYTEWIKTFTSGANSEITTVSGLFTLIIAYFAGLIFPTAITMGVMWPLLMIALVVVFMFSVIYQTVFAFALLFVAAAASIAFLSLKRSGKGVGATKIVRVAFPLSASLLAVGFGVLLMNLSMNGPKDFVDNRLSPALRRTVLAVSPQFPLLYDISRAGSEFTQKELGGVPTLTATPIFEIQGTPGETVYIRTDILDKYNGNSWSISNRVLRTGTRIQRVSQSNSNSIQEVLRITPLVGNIDLLPLTLDTVRVSVSGTPPPVVEGNFDTGYRLEYPLKRGQTVELYRSPNVIDDLREDLRPYYLQLPSEIPSALRTLAAGLRRGTVTETLDNIQRFLAYNYSYNLTPDEPYTPNQDFVLSFLESTSGGYCVQFATTFVILARLNGIPARYATGYLAYIPDNTNKAQVTDLASHSWPEVWIDGRGWVTYEATTAVDPLNYVLDGNTLVYQYNLNSNPNTERQLQAILGRQVTTGQALEQATEKQKMPTGLIIVATVTVTLVVLAMVLLWVRGVLNPFRSRSERVYLGLRKLSRRLVKYGVPNPANVGWTVWTEKLASKMNGNSTEVREMGDFVVLNLYAEHPLPEDALFRVRKTARLVKHELKQKV